MRCGIGLAAALIVLFAIKYRMDRAAPEAANNALTGRISEDAHAHTKVELDIRNILPLLRLLPF
jgi:hypothetical protein